MLHYLDKIYFSYNESPPLNQLGQHHSKYLFSGLEDKIQSLKRTMANVGMSKKLLKYSRSEHQSCSSSVFVGCQLVALCLMIWKLSLLKALFIHPHLLLLLLALASPKPQQASAKLSLQTALRSSWTQNLRAMS